MNICSSETTEKEARNLQTVDNSHSFYKLAKQVLVTIASFLFLLDWGKNGRYKSQIWFKVDTALADSA